MEDTTNWLDQIEVAQVAEIGTEVPTIVSKLTLDLMLKDSLFYPASGLDMRPLRIYGIRSAVYVDYFIEEDKWLGEIQKNGIRGYRVLGAIDLDINELVPKPQEPELYDLGRDVRFREQPRDFYDSGRFDKDPFSESSVDVERLSTKFESGWIKKPFAKWVVFERRNLHRRSDKPDRISLLYICAEAIAAFQQLYVTRRICPQHIGIIRPGTGFGGNWTDFRDQNGLLARSVEKIATDDEPGFLISDTPGGYWPSIFPLTAEQQSVVVTEDNTLYLTARHGREKG